VENGKEKQMEWMKKANRCRERESRALRKEVREIGRAVPKRDGLSGVMQEWIWMRKVRRVFAANFAARAMLAA
jgi:hypothetical protein